MSTLFKSSRVRPFAGFHLDHFIYHTLVARSKELNKSRGQPMVGYLNDVIGSEINTYGVYEKDQLELLFKFLAPIADLFKNGIALDIGANIGNHSIYFSKYFNKVLSFEPHSLTHRLLAFNAQFCPNINTYNHGLGDRKGEFDLYQDTENFGASSQKFQNPTSQSIKIRVEKLDDLDLNLDSLLFIKIDVEGMETEVITGSLRVIRTHQPIIVLEQHESDFDGRTEETAAIKALRSLGYEFCWEECEIRWKNWFIRKIANLFELRYGKRIMETIKSDSTVKRRFYSMLIAVPKRFHTVLGFKS